jgi:hypothetical protein
MLPEASDDTDVEDNLLLAEAFVDVDLALRLAAFFSADDF